MSEYDMRTLEQDARDAMDERIAEGSASDSCDAAHEIADGLVPVYNYDLIQYAANDTALALDEPELGPAFDGSPTPVNIIAANIYERLVAAAMEQVAS